jgi:hypothetical protein
MSSNSQTSIVRGEALKVEDKTIYPVVELSTVSCGCGRDISYGWASPIAILVVDALGQYVIPL